MATDPSMSRRVSRLENDTESLDELVAEIRSTQNEHTRRLTQIDGRFQQIDGRFDRVEGTLGEILDRLPPRP